MFLGLISYPLYLWHWPILSVCNIIEAGLPSRTIRISAVVLSIVLATLTYYFIEPKLRYGKNGNKKALVLFLVMLIMGIYGITEYKYSYTQKLNPRLEKVETVKEASWKTINCLAKYPGWEKQDDRCFIEALSNKDLTVTVIGDSHSGQLLDGLYNLKDRPYNLHVFAISGHVPYYGFKSSTNSDKDISKMRTEGAVLWDLAFLDELKDPSVKVVVLAHCPVWSRNDITDTLNQNINLSVDKLHEIGAKRTFDLLKQHNKQVVIVKDNPWLPFDPKKCQTRPIVFHKSVCNFDRSIFDNYEPRNFFNSIVENVAKEYDNITFVDLSDLLCDSSRCYIKKEDQALYKDKSHLSKEGSAFVAPLIDKAVIKALSK